LLYERRKQRGEIEMNTTNTISGFGDPIVLNRHEESSEMNGPQAILRSALANLSDGRIYEVVEQFADCFTFNNHALALEFKDKLRLAEFFEKFREVFPDSAFEIGSIFESGDHAVAEWRLSTTESVPIGSISYRVPVSLRGSTIICVENGKIVQWSEYYDQSSLPIKLAAFFSSGSNTEATQLWQEPRVKGF
jgi:limonene-1,2-epoxide hydrolase